jgi:hypothetical protein
MKPGKVCVLASKFIIFFCDGWNKINLSHIFLNLL